MPAYPKVAPTRVPSVPPPEVDDNLKACIKSKLRPEFEAVCKEKLKAERRNIPAWIPKWLTAELGFKFLHWWALLTTVYGLCWTGIAVSRRSLPDEFIWKPMELFKLAYPMLPVILGCWLLRYKCSCSQPPLTAGYYFANLKMGLLPSLGPGLLIGVVLDKLIVRPAQLGVPPGFKGFILPLSWILGCTLWFCVSCFIQAHAEQHRKNWGDFASLYIEPSYDKRWQNWIHKGPHSVLFIIDAPKHGTFHKVAQANLTRSVGITVCCIIMWVLLLVWWCCLSTEEWQRWWTKTVNGDLPSAGMLIYTDFPNLFFNTLTAPILLFVTWRSEPHDLRREDQVSNNSMPLLMENEQEELLDELVDLVSALPLGAVSRDEGLMNMFLNADVKEAVIVRRRSQSGTPTSV